MSNNRVISSLSEVVHVRQSSTRSVNVEMDFHREAISEGYILTAQARRSLARVLEQAQVSVPQRAWTLTGPYGSGKSYFGLFLMNLLCNGSATHKYALQQLREVDPILADSALDMGKITHGVGFLPIAMTGYRAPIQQCILQGIRKSLESLRHESDIQSILSDDNLWDDGTKSRGIVRLVQHVLEVITKPSLGYRGILLVLDEMGKPLEYAATYPDQSDIFLLQELAELANRSADTPIIFLGMLHQSFERYAGRADNLTQREWAKIQGRFEDVAFQEPPSQQMWLLANALEYSDKSILPGSWSDTIVEEAVRDGWSPSMMKESEFRLLCKNAVPFHPTALVVLPYLFQRLAQNERSIFAYLTSSEPRGFQTHLLDDSEVRQVRLFDLFDYLAANFQGRLYSTLRARPLTETIERLESEPNLSAMAVALLKTIGLLNWLAEVAPFQASLHHLLFALRGPQISDVEIRNTLDKLVRQSSIVFRRYNQSYAIWQGSDVDIEERIEEARQRQLSEFSTAQAVQQYLTPQPIVARRHSYRTGTTQFFEVRYVDMLIKEQIEVTPSEGVSGVVLLCLSESPIENETFAAWAQETIFQEQPNLVIGVLSRTPRLAELLKEMRCLQWVRENTPELRDDPVARRELRTRLNDLETLVRNELDMTIRMHRNSDADGFSWYHRGQRVQLRPNRGLSHLLSEVCDRLYQDSPIVRNEILNRRQLSSQGAGARRNLIEAMLQRSELPGLGIEGYPPERSMYESLLKAGGLHQEIAKDRWALWALPPNLSLQLHSIYK